MASKIHIKVAGWDDLPTIARLHVAVWRQAYVGQVPQEYLDKINEADRLARWQDGFKKMQDNPDPLNGIKLAVLDNEPVGFISYGRSRDNDRQAWPEIWAVYVLDKAWGRGVGFALFSHAVSHFRLKGHNRTFLWALGSNDRAISSYVKWGGVVETERHKDFDAGNGVKLKEISVRFAF